MDPEEVQDEGQEIVDGNEGAIGEDNVVDAPVEDKPKDAPVENQMLEGIKKALTPQDPEAQKKAESDAAAAATKKKADEEFAAANKGKTPEELAALQATREAEAKKKAGAEEAAKLKAQKADDFVLSPQMKKYLSGEAQQRFHQLHRYAKEQEGTVLKLTETNKTLAEARDGILGVLQETNTSQDELIGYLTFNQLIHSNDPGDLKKALGIVENQRAALYRVLGIEGQGVDLLADFPDLQKEVEDSQITRERALEIANGRRRDKALEQQSSTQTQQQRTEEAQKKSREDALSGIETWSRKMAGEDIDYKKKEEKLLAELPEIIKGYPPNLWLPTFQRLYKAIEVVKPPPPPSNGSAPLRPSGAKPGARQFTELTPDALRAGLGYPPGA